MNNGNIDDQIGSSEGQQNPDSNPFYNNVSVFSPAYQNRFKTSPPNIKPRRTRDYWPKHITNDGKR